MELTGAGGSGLELIGGPTSVALVCVAPPPLPTTSSSSTPVSAAAPPPSLPATSSSVTFVPVGAQPTVGGNPAGLRSWRQKLAAGASGKSRLQKPKIRWWWLSKGGVGGRCWWEQGWHSSESGAVGGSSWHSLGGDGVAAGGGRDLWRELSPSHLCMSKLARS